MNKIILLLTVALVIISATLAWAWLGGRDDYTPDVRYIWPKNESVVELKGKKSLTFRWQPTPIPGGNRAAYKFELFKEFSYERIMKEMLSPHVSSIEVTSDKFEDSALYTWQVKQRDEWTRFWSTAKRWSFRVRK